MFRDCDELESWIKEKEVVMKAEEKSTGKERVEAMHKKFEVSRAAVVFGCGSVHKCSLIYTTPFGLPAI